MASPPTVSMTLPAAFVEDLRALLKPFARSYGVVSISNTRKMLGRVARAVYIVPLERPFAASLWAAAAAAERIADTGRLEAAPGHYPARRFGVAAAWFLALLDPHAAQSAEFITLERKVTPSKFLSTSLMARLSIVFDASPWGGGAILLASGIVTEYVSFAWEQELADKFDLKIGQSSGQSFWESLTVLVSLVLWLEESSEDAVAIIGDNVGALTAALQCRAKGKVNAVARELAWRTAKYRWRVLVGHLPSEANAAADALSRTKAPAGGCKPFPASVLSAARRRQPPNLLSLWKAVPEARVC